MIRQRGGRHRAQGEQAVGMNESSGFFRRWRQLPRRGPLDRTSIVALSQLAVSLLVLVVVLPPIVAGCSQGPASPVERDPAAPEVEWPHYGGDAGGSRFSPLDEITPQNVAQLREVWRYHTGDLPSAHPDSPASWASEVTPIFVAGSLYLCTPTNQVIALDPETGAERWRFDPAIPLDVHYANQMVCRGVSFWRDPEAARGARCAARIFTATNDARLIALDAATGRPCEHFGDGSRPGEIDLQPAAGMLEWPGEYQVTSPPALVGDSVVVGSAVSDNQRTDAPSGLVRAFDARSGALRWAWDLRPPDFVPDATNTSAAGYALATPNVWAPMAVDESRDLVFVPTGNPSLDYYRGAGSNDSLDYYGSSIVALRGRTGEVVWHFQTVHHDVWDYDIAAQPTLLDLERDGSRVPALVAATKMGMLFVLNRETGEPLFEVEERPVPGDGAPGQRLSPTQPFPVRPPPLVRHTIGPDDALGLTPFDGAACRREIEALRYEGIYTPPTVEGTLALPGNAGGVNWGGVAVDAKRGRLVVNVQDFAWIVRLVPRIGDEPLPGYGQMRGTPYGLHREMLMSPLGTLCSPRPWGKLVSVDLREGVIEWEQPFGSTRRLLPIPLSISLGLPSVGGPLLTESGLLFIGASFDDYLRAYDASTGEELWRESLPAGGQATPMTYRARKGGRQYLLIAATGYGHSPLGDVGDAIIAWALD